MGSRSTAISSSARRTIPTGSGPRPWRTWASSSPVPGSKSLTSRAGRNGRRGSSAAERTPEAVACVSLGEDGRRRTLTFADLSDQVTRLAEALAALGVGVGDRVAIYLPMSQEAAVASHACAHLGAIQVPIFSGFAAPAVAQRLRASEAKVAITTPSSLRRGREVPMLEILEEAGVEAPALEDVVVAPWDDVLAGQPSELPAAELDSETPYLLTYTSGTTGRPKGVVHVQGGFLVS